MPGAIGVTFELHRVSDPRPGEWCPACTLPSVVSCDFSLVSASSLRVFASFTASVCTECGEPPERDE